MMIYLDQHECPFKFPLESLADYGNRSLYGRRHGVLLVWAPLASLSLVG